MSQKKGYNIFHKINALKHFTQLSTCIKAFCRYNADVNVRTAACLVQFSKMNIYMKFYEIKLRSVTEIFSSYLTLLKQIISHNFHKEYCVKHLFRRFYLLC
jgi:hypothetical protein